MEISVPISVKFSCQIHAPHNDAEGYSAGNDEKEEHGLFNDNLNNRDEAARFIRRTGSISCSTIACLKIVNDVRYLCSV